MPAKASEIIGKINVNQNKTMPKIFFLFFYFPYYVKKRKWIHLLELLLNFKPISFKIIFELILNLQYHQFQSI